ncbi:MAG: hypothetical protein AAFY29_22915 [Pseudomonadota bacterium]
MFQLENTQALVRSINPRVEMHGDETELACDIGLEFALSNKKLQLLDESLLSCLYRAEPTENSDSQETLDMGEEMLPHLRFPLLIKFPWDYEGAGYTFELVDDGLFGDHSVKIGGCKVKKFEVEPEEGGTIKLRLQVQAHPSNDVIGELCEYIKQKVKVSLIPPSEDDAPQGDIEDEVGEAA